jgi:hypothetical protein
VFDELNCYLAGKEKTKKAVAVALRVSQDESLQKSPNLREYDLKGGQIGKGVPLFHHSRLFKECIRGTRIIERSEGKYTEDEIERISNALFNRGKELWTDGFVEFTYLQPQLSPIEAVEKYKLMKAFIDFDYLKERERGKGVERIELFGYEVNIKNLKKWAEENGKPTRRVAESIPLGPDDFLCSLHKQSQNLYTGVYRSRNPLQCRGLNIDGSQCRHTATPILVPVHKGPGTPQQNTGRGPSGSGTITYETPPSQRKTPPKASNADLVPATPSESLQNQPRNPLSTPQEASVAHAGFRCWQHNGPGAAVYEGHDLDPDPSRCRGVTKKGAQCNNRTGLRNDEESTASESLQNQPRNPLSTPQEVARAVPYPQEPRAESVQSGTSSLAASLEDAFDRAAEVQASVAHVGFRCWQHNGRGAAVYEGA